MNYLDQAVVFECQGESLLGILSLPETPRPTAVLMVVGGPQYRVGSHRQFLLLSRVLAAAGFPVLRFDYRGMGDSSGARRNFDNAEADIAAAVDAVLKACPGTRSVVLWGLCDAASAALLYYDSRQDPRINGMVLLNPWVRSETTLAKTHIRHYYLQRLFDPGFWRKLFSGRLGMVRAISGFINTLRQARRTETDGGSTVVPYQVRMARGAKAFPGRILLILSGNDYTAWEFADTARQSPVWTDVMAGRRVTRAEVAEADHTFSSAAWRAEVERLTLEWILQHE